MHVLVISRSFPPHRHGGMEQHAQDVVAGLIAAGHRVSVITTPFPAEGITLNGDLIISGRKPGSYDLSFVKGFEKLGDQKSLSFLGRSADTKPDIIHAQGFAGIAAERYLKSVAPIVTTIHGTLWSETPLRNRENRSLGNLWRYKHRFAISPSWRKFLRGGTRLIVDSQFSAEELERELGRKLTHAPTVVPLGFDTRPLEHAATDRAAARASWGINEDQILFAAIGRLTPIKNFQLVAKGFSEFNGKPGGNTRLIIAGDGTEKSNIIHQDKLVEALWNFKIMQLPGSISQERAAQLLVAADVFVNADGGTPAFGLANAEALVAGTPVLAFDTGAHREVVRDQDDGGLLPMKDPEGFKAAMASWAKELPEHPEKRATRARRARERFSRDLMIERLLAVYERTRKEAGKT
ncbi:glycosyltransferase family 4 protein [Candidatus Sumerlaeota bacterium]|nr:glycosyltransferase family 4 protein [Candidatus Sumerlaeota bacterium]